MNGKIKALWLLALTTALFLLPPLVAPAAAFLCGTPGC
jgi:hypothetical protein